MINSNRINIFLLFIKLWIKYEADDCEVLSEKQASINQRVHEWHNMQYEINMKDYGLKKVKIVQTHIFYLALFQSVLMILCLVHFSP